LDQVRHSARHTSLRRSILAAVLTAAALLPAAGADAGERDRYIVVFKDSVGAPGEVAREHARRYGAEVSHVYRHALKGYAAEVPAQAVAGISRDRRVAYVEADQQARALAQDIPTGIRRTFAAANPGIDIDGSDDLRVDVDVAVIDTGTDLDHPDLNVVASTNCAKGGRGNTSCDDGHGDDGNGHGTHVAGTIGAIDNGIGVVGMAPGARLWAVRVLGNNGSGWMSWIVAGIDWVTARAGQIEVANMSLGCECSSSAMDQAIAGSVDAGVVHAVAAGNSDADATDHSPANHPDVITVSALADFDGQPGALGSPICRSDQDDSLADFSNWGSRVELAAPGVCILSTWKDGGYGSISGTSMASPHAAGAAALLASGANDPGNESDVFAIRQALITEGNLAWVDDSGDGIQEPLLDVSDTVVFAPATVAGSGGSGSTNSPPTASFTSTCSTLTCDFDGTGSSDPDGTISTYAWAFGDGGTGSGATASHGYAAGGTYTVTLTVTDEDGALDSEAKSVSVGFTLTASGHKTKGLQKADLQWSGTDGVGNVAVQRNGAVVATAADSGSYTDHINNKGKGSYTYKLCEEGTTNCSNEATVIF
jgi:subtilisin